jgi:hypothetical protein
MKLTQFAVDDGPHSSDGSLLHGRDGDQHVTGFISRRVMDDWVDPRQALPKAKKPLSRAVQRAGQAQPRGDRKESLQPNICKARCSIAGTRLWTFCYPTSRKVGGKDVAQLVRASGRGG